MELNVQFTGPDEKVICGYFSDHQEDEEAYPNQGKVDQADERWKSYIESISFVISQYLPEPT